MKKKAQLWYTDFIMALALFSLILTLMYHYINVVGINDEFTVLDDAVTLSELLLKEGIPSSWNQTNVIVPGVMTNFRLDEQKLYALENLTLSDYDKTKSIFGIPSDFMILFENATGSTINLTNTIIGKPGQSTDFAQADDVATLVRYVAYSNNSKAQLLAMKVITWQD